MLLVKNNICPLTKNSLGCERSFQYIVKAKFGKMYVHYKSCNSYFFFDGYWGDNMFQAEGTST